MKEKKNEKKNRKLSKTGRRLMTVLLVISLGVAGYSGYQIYSELHQYSENDQKYADLSKSVTTVVENESDDESEEESTATLEIDWDALRAINSDIAGWIKQEDTPIDYPIVYGFDNDYYLRHTMDGEYSIFGTIFVDYQNNHGFVDRNTVIYGHHFYHYDDTMFTTLDYYADQSYYDEHKSLDLYTPDGNYKLYPIAGVVKSGTENYVRTTFSDDTDYYNYVQDFINQSTFVSEETFSATDQVVLLSSCTDIINDGRYALFCKLVKVS